MSDSASFSALVVAGLLLAPLVASAQHAEVHAVPGACGDAPTHTLPTTSTWDGPGVGDPAAGDAPPVTTVRLVDGADRVLACVEVGTHGAVTLRSRPARDGEWLELDVDATPRGVFRLSGGALELVHALRTPDPGDAAEVVAWRDLDGDGYDELIRHRLDPIALPCGREDFYVQPAVFDRSAGVFRDAVIVPPAADAAAADVRPGGPDDRYPSDARVTAVSASARVGGLPSRDRGVVELQDGDPTTAWLEGRDGDGIGAWLRVDADAPIAGVVVDNGDGALPGPTRWLLATGDGALLRASTPPRGRFAIRLDPPTDAGCLAMMAVGLPDDATTFAVGGVTPLTVLDALPPADALAVIASVAAGRQGTLDLAPTLALFARVAVDAPDAALVALDDADDAVRPGLVSALAAVGDPTLGDGLAARAGDGRLAGPAVQAWLDAADPTAPGARRALLALATDHGDTGTAAATRLGPPRGPTERDALLDALASAPGDAVDVRLDALASTSTGADAERAGVGDAPLPAPLLAAALDRALAGSADIRMRMLRLAARVAERDAAQNAEPVTAEPSRTADALAMLIADDDGTIARLGIAIAGRARVEPLRETLVTIATADPADELRGEALVALAALGGADAVLSTAIADPSPTVRWAALTRLSVRWPAETLRARFDAETWPSIREALAAALAAHDALVVETLIAARTDAEATALLDALDGRPATVSATDWLELAEHFGGQPRVLRRLVDRSDGCTDPDLRAWLDRLAAQAPVAPDAPPATTDEAAPAPPPGVYESVHRAAARVVAACDAPR